MEKGNVRDMTDPVRIWETCRELFQSAVAKALEFEKSGKCEAFQQALPVKTECAVGSRYLHRGFYCPSPVFDAHVTNIRRGRLLQRITNRSKITHRYFYGECGLYMVEYCEREVFREYILWDGDVRYGFVYSRSGDLNGVSAEVYKDGQLQTYLWSLCYQMARPDEPPAAFQPKLEEYGYNQGRLSDWSISYVFLYGTEDSRDNCPENSVDTKHYRVTFPEGKTTLHQIRD